MPRIEWSSAMSVGHAGLDGQHRILLDLYNRFDAAAGAGLRAHDLRRLLDELEDYTHRHFAAEEAILAGLGFAGLDGHRALHRRLTERVSAFRARLDEGRPVTDEFREFLGSWWRHHILEHDRAYGKALFPDSWPADQT